jgi:hypothetical protein
VDYGRDGDALPYPHADYFVLTAEQIGARDYVILFASLRRGMGKFTLWFAKRPVWCVHRFARRTL